MVCHKLTPMTSSKLSTQGSYTYKINDRMGQWLPMNNIKVVLANWIITSALATYASATCVLKHASNGSCCCWTFLHQFAHPGVHWLQYTSCFSACGTELQGHTKSFWKKKVFQFVSVCLQSSLVPALRESSCLSVTAALFFSEMRAKCIMWPCSKLL